MQDPGPPRTGQLSSEFTVTAGEVTCQQFVELVTDYFEAALPTRTLGQAEEHLVMCDWCATYLEQMGQTIAALRELREPVSQEPPASVLEALRAKRAAGR